VGGSCGGLEKKDIEVINNNQIKTEIHYFPFNRDTSLSVASQQDSPNGIKTLIEPFPINLDKKNERFSLKQKQSASTLMTLNICLKHFL